MSPIEGPKKRPKQCVHYASPTGCLRGKDCLYLHQNDPVAKRPLAADPIDVQRLQGRPPPPALTGATQSNTSAVPKPVVSMIRVIDETLNLKQNQVQDMEWLNGE